MGATTAQTRAVRFMKLYVLKVFFSNRYVAAQVMHMPTRTVAASASSQEKGLRSSMSTHADVAAAGEIGGILAARLRAKEIPAVSFSYAKDQRYHGKLKALLDNIRDNGIKFVG